MALKVKVGLIGALDMLKFKNQPATREKAIAAAPDKEVSAVFASNEKAKLLHPDFQKLVVTEIVDRPGADAKTYVFKSADDKPLAYFRAGQYLSLSTKINGAYVNRPYSISSSPKRALEKGEYTVTVKKVEDGFMSDYLLDNLKVGDEILSSGPQGHFYYEPMRDAKHVVALAGGSGITPFLSMAAAICEGTEDFNLTVIFGCRDRDNILFKEEFEGLCANEKIKVVHVLSEEEVEGFDCGFITKEVIEKYAPDKYSIFVCGPEAMYRFVEKEIAKLKLPTKFVRRELMGVTKTVWELPGYPAANKDKVFKLKVSQCGKEFEIDASANETILTALERAGIAAPSRCRSGECGFCHSKLLSGKVYIPEENDGRRFVDERHSYVHPCSSFLLSDAHIDVPGVYQP